MAEDLLLQPLIGARCRLWQFTTTHDRLIVRIRRLDDTVQFLLCAGCVSVSMPVYWTIKQPSLQPVAEGVCLVDEGVKVVCEAIRLVDRDPRLPELGEP